jgi:hypothetical protein
MKKESKIRIRKGKEIDNNYTFLEDNRFNSWSLHYQRENLNKRHGENRHNTKNIKKYIIKTIFFQGLKVYKTIAKKPLFCL